MPNEYRSLVEIPTAHSCLEGSTWKGTGSRSGLQSQLYINISSQQQSKEARNRICERHTGIDITHACPVIVAADKHALDLHCRTMHSRAEQWNTAFVP